VMLGAKPTRRRLLSALEAIAFALAVLLLGRRLVGSNLPGAVHLISKVGPSVLLALVPFAMAMVLDTLAQRSLLLAIGQRVRFGTLYVVRLAAEAAQMSLPAGAVFAETLTPLLLKQRSDVPYGSSIVANAGKKWLTIRAQAGYIALSFVIGFGTLAKVSPALIGSPALPWITLAAAFIPLVGSWMLGATLRRKDWAKAVRSFPSLARYQLDIGFDGLASAKSAQWKATLLLFGGWLLETIDTLVILRLLGAQVGFAEVIAFEAGLALVRSLAFFAPAGLGVQDLGYMAFLGALGLPGAAELGAAFVLLKRAKEALFIVCGGGLFLALRRAERSPALATEALP